MTDLFEHFRLVVDNGQAPMRIDKYMSTHLEGSSRSRIQQALKEGYVSIDNQIVKPNYLVKPNDIIIFSMPYRKHQTEIIPQDIPLNIVYEDEDVLVVNKPAGMVVHPGHGNYDGTLLNALSHYLGVSQEEVGDERLGLLVHRIDKDTSGLLVVSKNAQAQVGLASQFFEHSIERCYQAIVWGDLKEDEGSVESYIGRDPNDRLIFKNYDDESKGKWALTHYKVLERFGFVTLIECRLETGRTHQIRVHLSSLGHPIFNDERYGGNTIRKGTIYSKYKQFIANCFSLCPRQALHAKTLGFKHPKTGELLRFDSALPEDMTALLEKWRKYCSQMPEYEQ